jgi:hypothetical protein
MSITRWMLAPALVAGWLMAAGPAPAAPVNDEAGLFSADAVKKADQVIQKIQRDYGTGLTIDTVPRIPANLEGKFKQLGKDEFFRDWAESKAKRERDKGIYVLICKNPGRVEVLVDEQTRAKNFTLRDRNALVKTMLVRFGEKKWDEGLLDGVNFVESSLRTNGAKPQRQGQSQANKSETAPPPAGGSAKRGGSWMDNFGGIGGLICIGVVVLLGLWLVFGLIRAFTGMGRGGYGPGGGYGGGPGYGGGGGGGGFMSSLLGGMFGAAAGMWMYNSFFGGGSHFGSSAYGGTTPTGGGEPADTGAGDFSGDAGGGGDFGGDDGGGGGGGDVGGGGGDFGGGGGDFGGGGGGDF